MFNKLRLGFLAIAVIVVFVSFSGCSAIDSIERKLGVKNNEFEYLNTNIVEKISIQSTRDVGFKFIVTEPNSINTMYTLLSKGEVSENKSQLEPDYIFEFDLGDEVKKFYYVVGSDEGNFYSNDKIFTVSKRLDEGIIQNLSFVRKPRDFDYVYYNSILEVLKLVKNDKNNNGLRTGINIKGDVDCLKYVFSVDLKKFNESANKIIPNVELTNGNEGDFDVVLTVKNRGYDSTNFKTLITVNNKKTQELKEYYIVAVNKFKEWEIEINVDSKPENW